MWRGRNCVLRLEKGSNTGRPLFTRPYRENQSEDYPNIETYIKFSSILNRLIKQKLSIPCRKASSRPLKFSIFTYNPMGRLFSVVPPLQSEEVRQRLPKSKFSENFHICLHMILQIQIKKVPKCLKSYEVEKYFIRKFVGVQPWTPLEVILN